MSNEKQVKVAVVMASGGDGEIVKDIVETLAPWIHGETAVVEEPEAETEEVEDAGDEAEPEEEPSPFATDEELDAEADRAAARGRASDAEVAEWVRRSEAGESIAEIARSVGRPISTVYGRVKAAKKRK